MGTERRGRLRPEGGVVSTTLAALSLLTACEPVSNRPAAISATARTSESMNCAKVVVTSVEWQPEVWRCENTEAVCYIRGGSQTGGVSCRWKADTGSAAT